MAHETSDNIHTRLLAVIDHAEADQAALVTSLTDAERAATGEPDRWSAKDQIAHLIFWRDRTLQRLTALRDGTPMPARLEEGDDIVNGRTFAAHQHTPWPELIATSARQFSDARQLIGQLSEAQLTAADEAAPDGEFPRSDRVVADFLEHPSEHFAQVYASRGDLARAHRQERDTLRTIADLMGRDATCYGYAAYNVARYFARHGEPAHAIPALREAVALMPALAEWSRQDPELAALRGVPEYEAIYK